MKKLWGGRFTKHPEQWVEEFGASIGFDQKLVEEDIVGSIAHCNMLMKCKIISEDEGNQLLKGLSTLLEKAKNNELTYQIVYEDIHLNIEKMLYEEVGAVAGKLHTARSRNDQVATDMHLYAKKQVIEIIELIDELQKAFIQKADQYKMTLIPGYTHLQRAQPILYSHYILAYFWMLQRDKERLQDSLKRIDLSPLGAGALSGTTFPIDRYFVMNELGFSGLYENSLDAVSDRDFIVELHSNCALIIMHLSRLSEELIIWSSHEFQFIELDDSYTTGSSMMPQKKNPDMAELIRGKTGRVYGNLIGLLTTLKALPLAYNKDMQEDKEGMFDSVETIKGSLSIMAGMISTVKLNAEKIEKSLIRDFSNATEIADYLASNGVPFREAHEITGKIVKECIDGNKILHEITLDEWISFHPLFTEEIYSILEPVNVVNRRDSYGGTGISEVSIQLENAKRLLV